MDTSRIALQLYSVRDALAQDFAGTLKRVAEMGYRAVETAFLPEGVTLANAAAQLRAHGLTPICAHVDLPLGDAREGVLRSAEAYGVRRIVWHGWPEDPRYSSLDGLRSLADEYSAASAFAASQGLSLGLHNHWWEMRPVGEVLPYRYMMQHAAPELFFELDAYWARVAGLDPLAVAREMGARLPLLHIKDGPAVRHQPMSALGTGVMDIPGLLAACGDALEYVIVELDECATDMLEAVAASRRYLASI